MIGVSRFETGVRQKSPISRTAGTEMQKWWTEMQKWHFLGKFFGWGPTKNDPLPGRTNSGQPFRDWDAENWGVAGRWLGPPKKCQGLGFHVSGLGSTISRLETGARMTGVTHLETRMQKNEASGGPPGPFGIGVNRTPTRVNHLEIRMQKNGDFTGIGQNW